MDRSQYGILVTGASRGLGREISLVLADAGFRVWAGVRDQQRSDEVRAAAAERGVTVEPVLLDVTNPASIDGVADVIRASSVNLYGLVNNAGISARAYFEDFPEERARQIMEVNLFGTMNVTRRVLPLLRKTGSGRIIMISSVGGRIGSMSVAPYCASKFAVEGFSEALSLEMRPFGINVSIIEPGIVKTDIWDQERRLLPVTNDRQSPYYPYFWSAETQAENLLKTSTLTPHNVAVVVLRAITEKNPRLRYVVGKRAQLVMSLRRHLPGELFERFYFGELLRRVKSGAASRLAGHPGSVDPSSGGPSSALPHP